MENTTNIWWYILRSVEMVNYQFLCFLPPISFTVIQQISFQPIQSGLGYKASHRPKIQYALQFNWQKLSLKYATLRHYSLEKWVGWNNYSSSKVLM